MDVYLNPKEQAEYLASHGITISPKTLAKLRCIGGGPRYRKFGNRVLSTPKWLQEWAESRMSAPVTNTSEMAAA